MSSSRISALSSQKTEDFLYSVTISPTFVNVQQGEFGSYAVKVARGSDMGAFSVDLSLIADSLPLKAAATFSPAQLNFEEGQSAKNATLKINSYGLEPGFQRFRVGAATHTAASADQAQSNPAALIVSAAETKQQSNRISESTSESSSTSSPSTAGTEQKTAPASESVLIKPNRSPVARAGQDQVVKEGDKVTLDGSTSTDPDKNALSFSWEQVSPRQPVIKLLQSSDTSNKVLYTAPEVDKDTTFKFKLTVKDTRGGLASDSVNILTKNVASSGPASTVAETPSPAKEQPNSGQTNIQENHSPTAEARQALSTDEGKSLSITLKGNDADENDLLSFEIVTNPSHGTLAGFDKTSGSLTYVPDSGFVGQDKLAFKVTDSHGSESNIGTVSITVRASSSASSASSIVSSPPSTTSTTESSSVSPKNNESSISVASTALSSTDTEIIKSKLRDNGGEKIPNQYIIVLKDTVTPDKSNSIVSDAKNRGGKILNLYERAVKGFAVNVPNERVLSSILNRTDVLYAEADVKVQAFAQTLPTGINRVDGDISVSISGDGAGSVDADIAIVDTGIQLNHPDLNVYRDKTFVTGTTSGNDDNGHGTHVAGIAAAKDNTEGVVGMAPGARLWAVKVLDQSGSGSLSNVIAGIDYVTNQKTEPIDVLNLSLGCKCHSNALDSSIHSAVVAGVTVVVAAGNSGSNAQAFSPANNPDVIAVSAIADSDGKCGGVGASTSYGKDDSLASFSNYGSVVDLSAPGVNILSTYKGSSYTTMSGTSMASPHVAGAAALYKSQNPSASPANVRSAIVGAGSTAKSVCDGNGYGYFSGDKDNFAEPLVYAKDKSISSSLSQSTNNAVTTNSNKSSDNTSSPNGSKGKTLTSSAVAGEIYRYITQWGSSGPNTGQFNNPHAVAIDSSGNVYVVDSSNHRVQKFDSNGNFITKWGTVSGSGIGQFNNPQGIAVGSGSVFVVDTGNNRIQKFNSDGTGTPTVWGGPGTGNSNFNTPSAAAFSSGFVYITDTNNKRVVKYQITSPCPSGTTQVVAGVCFVTKWGSTGSGNGKFNGPHGIAVDSASNVFVVDTPNNVVQKFTNTGGFLSKWGTGTSGSGNGQFNGPHGVAVDSEGSVYVTDRGNNRVQKFTNAGGFLTKWGTAGTADGQFNGPDGVAISPGAGSSGKVYVTDIGNNRVQVFAIDTTAPGAPTLLTPQDLAVTNNDKPPFDWSDVTDLSGVTYSLLVDNDNAFGSPEISASALVNSAFTPTTALPDAKYYWKVNAKDGAGNIGPYSSAFSFTVDKQAPTVTADPLGGTYNTEQSVTLTLPPSEPATTKIYYTTDGTDPTTSGTKTLYSAAISISTADGTTTATTLKFYALDAAGNSGTVGTEVYTIDKQAPTVTATPAGGLYNTDQSVTLTLGANEPATTKIYYTTDGTDPIISPTNLYSGAIAITTEGDTTLKFFGVDAAGNSGTISTEVYTIDRIAPTVTADPAGGLYNSEQSITLTSTEANTIIYYTTDGTDPTTSSTPYDAAISITTDTTLKFFGVDAAGNAEAVQTQAYTIDTTPPTVASTEPETDAQDVAVNSLINATFSEPMAITNSAGNFTVVAEDGVTNVDGTISWSDDNMTATFHPTSSLDTSPGYTVTIKGGTTGIKDKARNSMVNDYSWSFSTPASITLTLDPNNIPKWGFDVNAQGTVIGARATDKISLDWGDGTVENPILADGQFSATHAYAASAIANNPNKVVAKLLSSTDIQRAITGDVPELSVTVQKHATSLTVDMKPSPSSPVCGNCGLDVFGKLVDIDTTPNTGIDGKTVGFTGTGVTPSIQPVQTEGVTFTGALTLTSSILRMPVGSEISLPASTRGVTYNFQGASSGSTVGVTLTKAGGGDPVIVDVPVGSEQNAYAGNGRFTTMTITSVGGSTSTSEFAELSILTTVDPTVDPPEQHQIDFSNIAGQQPGPYSTLVINPGSYFSIGATPDHDGDGLKIKAEFDGTNDPAYLGVASSELSYDVDSSGAGAGEGSATADDVLVWTKLNVGSGTAAGDVCTVNGVAGTDDDKDNICDRWEDSTNTAAGNDATHRYITCPTTTGNTGAIDPQCANLNQSIKYNLCAVDNFAGVWGVSGKPDGTVICPTKGHKDLYVEFDYMSSFAPSSTAIKNVVRAFGKAPLSNSVVDAFNNLNGITLHVVKDNSLATVNNLFVWKDPAELNFNDNNAGNDFFNIKKNNFGTSTERGGTSGMPGMTAAAWTSTGKVMKHYVYHYALSANYYSKTPGLTCPVGGLSSGLAETLGNDLIVSLGCGFKPYGDNVDSNAEQAGTFMHELGHNLNLAHGGPNSAVLNVRTATDYNMNCKPNYLSVMNYARQIPNSVYDRASWEAAFNYGGAGYQTALDYSRTTAPSGGATPGAIAETGANEVAGTAAADGKLHHIIYYKSNAATVNMKDSGANFDFNGDGVTNGAPAADVNNVGSKVAGCGPLSGETERSYNDWNDVKLQFLPDGDSQDGATTKISQPYINPGTIELGPAFDKEVAQKDDDARIRFIPPPNTDGSTTFNPGSSVPLKFELKDKDGNFVSNAVVTVIAQKGTAPALPSAQFVYDATLHQYKYVWTTPSGTNGKGVWTLKYFRNYQSTDPALPQILYQGPEANIDTTAPTPYTLKITGLK
jgi:subtilisin